MTGGKPPREYLFSRPTVKSLGQSYEEADLGSPEITDLHCRKDERTCRGESYCACQCESCKTAYFGDDEGGEETPEEEAARHAAFEREGACPPMVVLGIKGELFDEALMKSLGLDGSKFLLINEELEDSFRYYPPDFAKIDLDMARAHLLRTLEVKRCKDVMRSAPWVGFIDDPDSFVPPSERTMELARAWYTEAFPIREKK